MPPRLGEILVGEGACTADALRDALRNQVIFGGRLGTNLLELKAVTEAALAAALGRQHGVPALSGALHLDPAATALLRAEVAERCDAVPYVLADRRMALLVVDPADLAMLDEVAFATGKQVHPIVVPEARIWALLRQAYGIERHLRGIEVDFGALRAAPTRPAGGAPAAERAAGPDLMDEEAFESLYAKAGSPAPPQGAPVAGARRAEPPTTSTAVAAAARLAAAREAPPAAIAAPPTVAGAPLAAPAARPGALDPALALADHAGATSTAAAAPRGPPLPPPPPGDVVELSDLLVPSAPPSPSAAPLAPEVVAALQAVPGHAPPARLARTRSEEPEPSPLGFEEALRFLEGVDERSAIAKTVLRYARSRFRRAVLLTVHRGAAHGWAGLGEKLGADAVRHIHVALGAPGIVETVVSTRAHYLGPIPKTEANIRLLRALGGGVPANAFLVPILATGRVVNVFYADNGRGGFVDAAGVGELLILATRIAKSYDALLARVR